MTKCRFNRRRRRGVALVAALSLMTFLGLVIVGAIAATTLAERASRAALIDGPLGAAADVATTSVLADPVGYGVADLSIGVPATFSVPLLAAPGISASVSVTRLVGGTLWIVANAWTPTDTLVHRRISSLARFPLADAVPSAPIVSGGSVQLAPDVTIGRDTIGAPDCAQSAIADSLITADSTKLYEAGWQRIALDSSTAIHVRGDTTIAGGAFSGLLLIDGDLTVTGTFTMTGLAIVRGKVVSPRGLVLSGALVAGGGADLAAATIKFSPCVIGQVVRHAIRLRPVRGRGWAEMF